MKATVVVIALISVGCAQPGGRSGTPMDVGATTGLGDASETVADGTAESGDGTTDDGTPCVDLCVVGAVRCSGDGVERCEVAASGCAAWGSPTACAAGLTCSNGACSATCSDECLPSGLAICDASGAVVTCGQFDDDSCLDWSTPSPCGEGTCSNGHCVESCVDACETVGVQTCDGAGYRTCGQFDADGCRDLSDLVACPDGTTCSAGKCSVDCVDDCVDTWVCDGASQRRPCGQFDNDACKDLGPAQACDSRSHCADGACVPSCEDECASGAKRCVDGALETCGNVDGDACLEWSAGVVCGAGLHCEGGACIEDCAGACELGTTTCSGTTGFKTCAADANGCGAPGLFVSCAEGNSCGGGACKGRCVTPDIYLVVDRSSSTSGPVHEMIRGAIGSLVGAAAPNVRLGLRLFPGASACAPGSPTPLTLSNWGLPDLIEAPSSLSATPLGEAVDGLAPQFGDPQQGEAIILITDGTDTCGGADGLIGAANAYQARGVRVYTIGVGAGFDAELLSAAALAGGTGTVTAATSREALETALFRIVSEVSGCAASGPRSICDDGACVAACPDDHIRCATGCCPLTRETVPDVSAGYAPALALEAGRPDVFFFKMNGFEEYIARARRTANGWTYSEKAISSWAGWTVKVDYAGSKRVVAIDNDVVRAVDGTTWSDLSAVTTGYYAIIRSLQSGSAALVVDSSDTQVLMARTAPANASKQLAPKGRGFGLAPKSGSDLWLLYTTWPGLKLGTLSSTLTLSGVESVTGGPSTEARLAVGPGGEVVVAAADAYVLEVGRRTGVGTWSWTRLSDQAVPDAGFTLEVDARGVAHVVWRRNADGRSEIVYSTEHAGVVTEAVLDTADGEVDAELDGDVLHVVIVDGQLEHLTIGLAGVCTASCAGRVCGDDGCGGSCGSCPTGTCAGGQCLADAPVINEIYYDSPSTDDNGYIEIEGPAGLDLAGWMLIGINGDGGAEYKTVNLSGAIPSDGHYLVVDSGASDATLRAKADQLAFCDLQNGPDSLQLVDPSGAIVDALAYGVFAATDTAAGEGTPATEPTANTTSALGRSPDGRDTDDNASDFRSMGQTPGAANTTVP